jgi:hypothetical protein
MFKCRVLHTHMIKVVKQKERIPNVDRCVGCPTHKYGGSPGVVVLVVVSPICLWVRRDKRSNNRQRDQLIAVRRGGFTHGYEVDSEQPFIY